MSVRIAVDIFVLIHFGFVIGFFFSFGLLDWQTLTNKCDRNTIASVDLVQKHVHLMT